jgi:hypothetical protein
MLLPEKTIHQRNRPASTSELVQQIIEKNRTDEAKVHDAYTWVIQNIKYSTDSELVINAGLDPEAKINVAFKRRKGTCENFAAIFNDLCKKMGINSFVIYGYTQQNGRVDRAAHTWCAAFVDDQWYLYDPTWDLGYSSELHFYKILPKQFIESHMPFDPLWQFLEYPVSHLQFAGKTDNQAAGYFNAKDSLKNYFDMDSLQRFQSSVKRMEAFGIYNSKIKTNYLYQKMNIEIINQGREVDLYTEGVALLNEAVNKLNDFLKLRNDNLAPSYSSEQLQQMLKVVEDKINASIVKITEAEKGEAQLKLSMDSFRERAEKLKKKLADQQTFLASNLALDVKK